MFMNFKMLNTFQNSIDKLSLLLCTGSIVTFMSDYNAILTTAALLTTICYNCVKWYKETKRK